MHHDVPLISTIAVGFVYALIGGYIAARLKLPPLVGYLLAGVAVGPFTHGFVADTKLAPQLAEIGVILLMFGVGTHFSLRDLLAVRNIALPGALLQIGAATLMGVGLARVCGWSLGAGLVLGLALSVASTVVLLRALEGRNAVDSEEGRIAIGWLIVEDLVMVLVLVLLPAFAVPLGGEVPGGQANANIWMTLGVTLAKVAGFVALMLVGGVRVFPWLLAHIERIKSRELFTLSVVAIALGVAYGSALLFDVSFALGAFFAGMVVNESDHSHRASEELQPLQDVFAVLFFVSVGMLFDPSILVRQPLQVLAAVLIVVVGKSAVAYGLMRGFGRSQHAGLIVAAGLAQIGEFSFILAELGKSLNLLSKDGENLILAAALIAIVLNTPLFRAIDWLEHRQSRAVSAS